MTKNIAAGVFTKEPITGLRSIRVFRVVRTDVAFEDPDDPEKNRYEITVVDGNHRNTVLPCSREVFLDEGLTRLTNHYIDLYQRADNGLVVATDGYERNDFMNRITPAEDETREIVVVVNPTTGLSSVRERPYRVSAADVASIKRLVDAAPELRPRMLLGGKWEIKEIVDPGSGLRLVLTAPRH